MNFLETFVLFIEQQVRELKFKSKKKQLNDWKYKFRKLDYKKETSDTGKFMAIKSFRQ